MERAFVAALEVNEAGHKPQRFSRVPALPRPLDTSMSITTQVPPSYSPLRSSETMSASPEGSGISMSSPSQ